MLVIVRKLLWTLNDLFKAIVVICFLFEVVHFSSFIIVKADTSGTDWDYANGTLTITGSGDCVLFGEAPWEVYKNQIQTIYVNDGITSLGFSSVLNTFVSDSMFSDYSNLKKVILSDSIEYLGEKCFSNCKKLESVKLPASLTEIGESCFCGDSSLKEISLPSELRTIGMGCFANCKSLTSITIPDQITVLSGFVFQNCASLQSVSIPDALSSIGTQCFSGCTMLQTFDLPDTLQYLGKDAFEGTPFLRSLGDFVIYGDGLLYAYQGRAKVLTIPDFVKTITDGVFRNKNLLSVTIPSGICKIEENCFFGCNHLREIVILSKDTRIEPQGHFENLRICSLVDSYAEQFAAENGYEFIDISAEPNGKDMTLDYQKDGWSFGNSGEVFGKDYYLTAEDRQHLTELRINTYNEQNWEGSCVGLATTVILAKNHVFTPNQLQSGAESLSDITPTDAVVSMINYFQCTQNRAAASAANESDVQRFYRMTQIAKNVKYGESPFLLTFALASGSHGVVGYGQETGEWEFGGKTYDARILVWDSNFPNELRDDACLYYDSATFDYIIPYYGVVYTENASGNVGGIITVCNDLSVLNAYPYALSQTPLTGDLDENGEVNVKDAVILARLVTNDTSLEISEAAKANADINGDGVVSTVDLTTLLRVLAKSEFQQ